MLGNLKCLHLISCYNLQDVSMLSNVSSLILKDCFEIKKIVKVDKIKELYLPGEIVPNNLFLNSLTHLTR